MKRCTSVVFASFFRLETARIALNAVRQWPMRSDDKVAAAMSAEVSVNKRRAEPSAVL